MGRNNEDDIKIDDVVENAEERSYFMGHDEPDIEISSHPMSDFQLAADAATRLESMAQQLDDPDLDIKSDPDDEGFTQIFDLIKSEKLNKKLITETVNIKQPTREEVKKLVTLYYQIQGFRMMVSQQIKALEKENAGVSYVLLEWVLKNCAILESGIKDALEIITNASEVGRWLLSIIGVGPVIAAGCMSFFDIKGKEYASQFISYAGLNDNNRPWLGREASKKIINEVIGDAKVITDEMVVEIAARTKWSYAHIQKHGWSEKVDKKTGEVTGKWSKEGIAKACAMIPYNKQLKTLMWKLGQSIVKVKNKEGSVYGALLKERLVYETAKNLAGDYADQAAEILATKNIGKDTVAYSYYAKGQLPPAHINARCERWVVSKIVCHIFEEMYRVEYNKKPPRYYVLAHMEGEHNRELLPEVPYHVVPEDNIK